MFITKGIYLSFHFSCPEPPTGISGVGSFPVQSGGSLIFFPALLGVEVMLNRINHLHLGVVTGMCILPCWAGSSRAIWHVCVSIHLSVCLCICPYVCTSIHMSVYLLVYLHSQATPMCFLGYPGVHVYVGQASICLNVQLFGHISSSCL